VILKRIRVLDCITAVRLSSVMSKQTIDLKQAMDGQVQLVVMECIMPLVKRLFPLRQWNLLWYLRKMNCRRHYKPTLLSQLVKTSMLKMYVDNIMLCPEKH